MSTKTLERTSTKSVIDQLADIRNDITQEVNEMSFNEIKEFLSSKASVLDTHGSATMDKSFLHTDLYSQLTQKPKSYNTVAESRKIKDQIQEEIKDMDAAQVRAFLKG